MNWNKHTSYNRIQQHITSMRARQISITPLMRKLDLGVVLSELQCRRIYGAHVYVSIPTFAHLASSVHIHEEGDSARQLTQAVHLYQCEIFRIVEQVFGEYQVHFQGPKLHAVVCQPFGQQSAIAARAVLLQLVLHELARTVFPRVFPNYQALMVASGTDLGKTIATRNGRKKNRELLFVGSAANYAAKIIDLTDTNPRLTEDIYHALPKALQEFCMPAKTLTALHKRVYDLLIPDKALFQRLLPTYDIPWKPEESWQTLTKAKQEVALRDITLRPARRLIDIPSLSMKNTRHVLAVSLFADVTGYTSFIEHAEQAHTLEAALRLFHVIRREMSSVIRDDYGGLHVQFQGDRVQGLFHLPKNDEQAIALQAIMAAIGLQSSMEGPLKACIQGAEPLHLAIGVDMGETLISRLGVRRHRDAICLGLATEHAAELEEACDAEQIGISHRVYQALPENLKQYFNYNRDFHCYIATGLTM